MDSYRDYSVIILIVRDDNKRAVVFANYHHTVSCIISKYRSLEYLNISSLFSRLNPLIFARYFM